MTLKTITRITAVLGLCVVASPAQADTTSLTKSLSLGQSLTCTYQKTDAGGSQNGTMYIADKKMSGEIQVTSADGTYPIHMVHEDGWQYMWGGPFGEGQGMKMQASAAGAPGQQGPDMNEDIDFQCNPWPVDASKFVVPSNVQFMDMSQMVPGAAAGGMDMHEIQCGACDEAPEAERAQCKQMMGC